MKEQDFNTREKDARGKEEQNYDDENFCKSKLVLSSHLTPPLFSIGKLGSCDGEVRENRGEG